ncbi:MAG: hypothetical protein P8177_12320 [Gemmatimonadota bacterium]
MGPDALSLTPAAAPGYAEAVLNPRERSGGGAAGSGAGGGARDGARRRSFTFLERDGNRWSVFLATYAGGDGRWRGYFTFRTAAAELEGGEIRTADLFVENSEAEVDARARGLGRPLLVSLLESALHTRERRHAATSDVGRWFRRVLASRSEELVSPAGSEDERSLSDLRSLYDSYRIDQVSHLIALLEPDAFAELVDRLLDGREIDFLASDRLQLAMIVVQELEGHLPLPPFEVWARDYLARPAVYQRYSHELHREERLPE